MGCRYCYNKSEGFRAPEVADLLGSKGRPFLLLRWPGSSGPCGSGAEVGAFACVPAAFGAASARAGTLPGLVAPAHFLHFPVLFR